MIEYQKQRDKRKKNKKIKTSESHLKKKNVQSNHALNVFLKDTFGFGKKCSYAIKLFIQL